MKRCDKLTKKGFRDFLEILEQNEELLRVKSEVDLRYVSAIINQTEKAVLFEQVTGYDISVVGGIIASRRRLALAVGDEFQKITCTNCIMEAEFNHLFNGSLSSLFNMIAIGLVDKLKNIFSGAQTEEPELER